MFLINLLPGQKLTAMDLLYLKAKIPVVYDGLLFKVMCHAIKFTDVFDDPVMEEKDMFINTKKDEQAILEAMLVDIRTTGQAMKDKQPNQNVVIENGAYKGKKVFEAMQKIEQTELESFLKYIIARPKIYAGNTWKISEVFATWMVDGAPTTKE